MRSSKGKTLETRSDLLLGDHVIRSLTTSDISQVMAIERVSFRSPWSENMMKEEIDNPFSRFLLLEVGGRVLGYLCAWFVGGEVHLMNLATHPEVRRRGVARTLLSELISRAKEEGANRVFLEVREGNYPAQCLYRSMGFQLMGRRKGYYSDTGEDALVMCLEVEGGDLGG